jgi:predicted Zn-dependent peptidase
MDPEVKKTTLDNGVRIVSRVIPHVYSVSMGVWVNIGARDETLSENGLSHFIEHMIFKGTEKRSGYQIAKEFDAVGGQTNAFTAMENTCYHAKVVDRHLSTMVDILSDIFLNSTFSQSEVEKERPVIIQEIGMVEDAPDEYVHQLAGSNLWGDNPLGRSILGTRDNILGFDAGNIRDFFQRRYRPDCMVISLAGNFDHDQFVDLIAPTSLSI